MAVEQEAHESDEAVELRIERRQIPQAVNGNAETDSHK